MGARQLPPGQVYAAPGKWPLVGERGPAAGAEPWRLQVDGLVEVRRSLSLEGLAELGEVEREIDIHCVTRWSIPGARFRGVPLVALLDICRPRTEARFVSFVSRSARAHSTSLILEDARTLGVLLATQHEGQPIATAHGGPLRTITPGRYFYKSLKWLERIELLAEDRPGYWESEAGYHNHADPWREQRYVASNLERREVQILLASRSFAGRDLLSLEAAGLDLTGLDARRAILRNADFRRAHLAGASFEGANLSNARFGDALLHGASFAGADLEGADFCGADLTGADLSGASLFGATFTPEGRAGEGAVPARLDSRTRVDPAALDMLSPAQRAHLEGRG